MSDGARDDSTATASRQAPPVSVVVLSFNRPGKLVKALNSLRGQTLPPAEIIVVDNPSDSSAVIRAMVRESPAATLLALESNLGFAGGMNVGLSVVQSALVLLTEDDIVLAPDCLARLVDCLLDRPSAALVAPVIYNLGSGTVRSAGGEVTLGPVYRQTFHDWDAPLLSGDPSTPRAVGFIPGAIFVARTHELRALGGFREDFFMYGEDAELCLRIERKNLAVVLEPRATCHHQDHDGSAVSATVAFHKQKNLIALYLLHAPWHILPVFVLRYGALDLMRSWTDRDRRQRLIAAWAWALRHAPRLLRDRIAGSRQALVSR